MKPASRVMPMLSVADVARAMEFYADVLGGEKVYQFPLDGDAVFLTLRFGSTELGIGLMTSSPLHGRPLRPASGHRIELCVNVTDVDATVETLRSRGFSVAMKATDQPWGERAAYVEDPDGNLVLLVAPVAEP